MTVRSSPVRQKRRSTDTTINIPEARGVISCVAVVAKQDEFGVIKEAAFATGRIVVHHSARIALLFGLGTSKNQMNRLE